MLTERTYLEAERLVRAPASVRMVARMLIAALVVFALAALLAPWQQSLSGTGRVIAYAPVERRQNLEAPVNGRVHRWFVQEGTRVRAGEPIVELNDNDALMVERLDLEHEAASLKVESYAQRLAALRLSIESAKAARKSEITASEAKLRGAVSKLRGVEQKAEAADAAHETALLNVARVRALSERGLMARRELEMAELGLTKARTERDGARADILATLSDLEAARAALEKARAEGDAKVQEAEAKLGSGQSDSADSRASLARLEGTIARQKNQLVRAPRAGVVLQVMAAQGGDQVKQGDVLAVLVPDTDAHAVELWVDGNDAAIITEGRAVRLQFEGWPAVQFTGWPSVAAGTFGGVVAFIDPHDDGKGNFRVVVVPEGNRDPWPSPRFLRQGARTKGWVLLEQVTLGFELWRRFNGFPPMLEAPVAETGAPGKASGKVKE